MLGDLEGEIGINGGAMKNGEEGSGVVSGNMEGEGLAGKGSEFSREGEIAGAAHMQQGGRMFVEKGSEKLKTKGYGGKDTKKWMRVQRGWG